MPPTVFISHAGGDAAQARALAQLLGSAGIGTRFDRAELTLGDSFLAFMNEALTTSDYCLLLWSTQAAATPWVTLEWEAALSRSVQEKRSFLVVGRLEALDVPVLLGPRLRIDLFPVLERGVTMLIHAWRSDREAETLTDKPVGSAIGRGDGAERRQSIYIDSEQFRITMPMPVQLDEPAGAVLERLVAQLALPHELSYQNALGVRFSYQLLKRETPLARVASLAMQGIVDGDVVSLQTVMTPFSTVAPTSGQLASATFRDAGASADVNAIMRAAAKDLRAAVAKAGLRPAL